MKKIFLVVLFSVSLQANTAQESYEQSMKSGTAYWSVIYYLVDYLVSKNADKNSISGFCQIKNANAEAMNTPCHNVSVVLKNSEGEQQFKVFATEGKFTFRDVVNDRKYFLEIESKNLEVPQKKIGPLKKGDQVMLNVKLKKK